MEGESKKQATADKVVVYLAGDWKAPPVELADKIDATGTHVVKPRWWEDKVPRSGNMLLLEQEVCAADVFVMDMRGPRFGEHYYAGSHIGVGMARIRRMPIYVIPGDGETKVDAKNVYTSLLSSNVVTEEQLLEKLAK